MNKRKKHLQKQIRLRGIKNEDTELSDRFNLIPNIMKKSFLNKKKVVVIGGGFAGLNLVQNLRKNSNYSITVVDRNNYNYFSPLLYQVATSFLEPSSISYPFRKMFQKENINFRMGEVVSIDQENKIIALNNGELEYDILVFAAGAKTNFYGIESVQKNAIPMKTVDDALKMRNALLKNLERASITTDSKERELLMTIVVAGGGPTGVEVAGMLAEMKKHLLAKDYPELANTNANIYIVDSMPVLLANLSEKTHRETYKALENLDVKIKLNTQVKSYIDDEVQFTNGESIKTKSLIWTAGVTANVFDGIPQTSLGKGNRMIVDQYNKLVSSDALYAIGDSCIQDSDPNYPNGHPQLAQVAIQQGKLLAKNLSLIAKGKPQKAFIYFDKGDMAIVGRHNAVVDLFKHKLHLSGFLALMAWLFIHLFGLANYNNKLKTFYNWIVAYITKDQSLRMIFRS